MWFSKDDIFQIYGLPQVGTKTRLRNTSPDTNTRKHHVKISASEHTYPEYVAQQTIIQQYVDEK